MIPVVARDSAIFETQKKYRKIVVTGHVIEVYEMDSKPYMLSRKFEEEDGPNWFEEWEASFQSAALEARHEPSGVHDPLESLREASGRVQRSIMRTRNNVRRLALANFSEGARFVTFTFAENVTEVSEANERWKFFMRRIRRKYGTFKYLAVLEFQKRGAVHYHCLWDLPYIKKSELAQIWGNGFIKVNKIEHVDNIGAYVVKYMTKDLMDTRLAGIKAYQTSRGLERPLVFRDDAADSIYSLYGLEDKKIVFANSYISEHLGTIVYREYNLKRD